MKPYLIILTLLVLTGCVTVETNKTAEVPAFSRVLVHVKLDKGAYTAAEQLAKSFPVAYQTCWVGTDLLQFEAAEDQLQSQLQQCKSDVILYVEQRQVGQHNAYGSNRPWIYYAELRNAQDNKPFWKALTETISGISGGLPTRSIMRKMQQDGIIKGNIPATASSTASQYQPYR
jgi:hypothetical protein